MFAWFASPEAWVSLATLTALEIVLGIDNIIFISILVGRLPAQKRNFARNLGLLLAMLTRLALLFSIVWVANLTQPWFTLFGLDISGRDIILIGGGLFLLAKATHEIHSSLEGVEEEKPKLKTVSLAPVLIQIALLDVVFSLDSVITAVGLARHISIMAIAIIVAAGIMLVAAADCRPVDAHPTIKILALPSLILVGVTLMVQRFDVHVPKAIHLLCDGVFRGGGNAEHPHAQKQADLIQLRKEINS